MVYEVIGTEKCTPDTQEETTDQTTPTLLSVDPLYNAGTPLGWPL